VPKTAKKKKNTTLIPLDCDKLGLVAGVFFATIVMALCFFYQGVTGLETAVRVAFTFAVAYVVTHVLVRVIRRTTLTEMAEARAKELEEKRARAVQEAAEAGEDVEAGEEVEEIPGEPE